jgi:hypothetical protein
VNACPSTLYALRDRLDKIIIPDKSKLRNAVRKLAWPYKSSETTDLIEEIRQHRDNLNTALSADSMSALLKCLSIQEANASQVKDIDTLFREKQEIDTRIKTDKKRDRVLAFFLPVNPHRGLQTSVRLRHATTGFWLTENDIYSDWIRNTGSFLWLTGIPGAGKTVLSGLVIQGCMARATHDRAVAYFYCDYKHEQTLKIINILSAVASQLARQSEKSYAQLEKYYDSLHSQHHLRHQPDTKNLIRVLKDMVTNFDDVRIVIDGLDECGDNIDEPLDGLKQIIETQGGNVSIAVFSRDERDIRDTFESLKHAHIEVAAQSKDVDLYVRAEIEDRVRRKKLHIQKAAFKEEIIDQLVRKANGMYVGSTIFH